MSQSLSGSGKEERATQEVEISSQSSVVNRTVRTHLTSCLEAAQRFPEQMDFLKGAKGREFIEHKSFGCLSDWQRGSSFCIQAHAHTILNQKDRLDFFSKQERYGFQCSGHCTWGLSSWSGRGPPFHRWQSWCGPWAFCSGFLITWPGFGAWEKVWNVENSLSDNVQLVSKTRNQFSLHKLFKYFHHWEEFGSRHPVRVTLTFPAHLASSII